MKKRILLIITLGISFTPAVFAIGGPFGDPVVQAQTGEQPLTQIVELEGAAGCSLRGKAVGSHPVEDHSRVVRSNGTAGNAH